MQQPSHGHYAASIYALRYALSTLSHGIAFSSDAPAIMEAFFRFPKSNNAETYSNATPPLASEKHEITSYSDACWGNQVGNTVPDGTELDLFTYISMSVHIIT